MRNEKSLSRYREEQNLGETDMSLAGFVCIFLQKEFLYYEIHIEYEITKLFLSGSSPIKKNDTKFRLLKTALGFQK